MTCCCHQCDPCRLCGNYVPQFFSMKLYLNSYLGNTPPPYGWEVILEQQTDVGCSWRGSNDVAGTWELARIQGTGWMVANGDTPDDYSFIFSDGPSQANGNNPGRTMDCRYGNGATNDQGFLNGGLACYVSIGSPPCFFGAVSIESLDDDGCKCQCCGDSGPPTSILLTFATGSLTVAANNCINNATCEMCSWIHGSFGLSGVFITGADIPSCPWEYGTVLNFCSLGGYGNIRATQQIDGTGECIWKVVVKTYGFLIDCGIFQATYLSDPFTTGTCTGTFTCNLDSVINYSNNLGGDDVCVGTIPPSLTLVAV